ncbi:MAG TPA: SGNH/GDSL hydrolase family protein [Gemmatimonadaceae bacterium]|nr:SGNH/GDSL hydrolase family protein [Gemmatimonadaceae bacterium]
MKLDRVALFASIAIFAACADGVGTPVSPDVRTATPFPARASEFMSNYVAIGTSVSMGWMDDGVFFGSQNRSWTSQLAEQAEVEFTVPGIQAPGCQPPLATPLASFRRVNGQSAGSSAVCAANLAGTTLPAHNLAIENATTSEALNATPATASQGRGPVTSRVLPPGMTQMTAMASLKPTFVSVEFGGNEILPAQVGLLYPGVTFTPFPVFQANYSRIIDHVKSTGAKAVLVSIRTDLRKFPTIRTGPEIASQRAAFAAYNVAVSANCDASENYVFVRGKVLTAVITGITRAGYGLGPFELSCADVPGTLDYILTPADINYLNGLAEQTSDEIEARAAENGYAVFPLGVLYNKVKEDVPFELGAFLTSGSPYGKRISLDGVHPSADGHSVLARAARVAISKAYGTGRPD